MRSDWDPEHGKRVSVQKRYPDLSEGEWQFILRLVEAERQFIYVDSPEHVKPVDRLIAKIKKRFIQ